MEQDGERSLANAYEQAGVVLEAIDVLRCDLSRLLGCVKAAKASLKRNDVLRLIDGSHELSMSSSLTEKLHSVVEENGDMSDLRDALLDIQIEAERRVTQCTSYARSCVVRMLLESRVAYYLALADGEVLERGLLTLTSIHLPCEGSSVNTQGVMGGVGDVWLTLVPYQVNCYEHATCALYLLNNDESLLSDIRGSECALLFLCVTGRSLAHVTPRKEDTDLVLCLTK
jgi:hypothetical protein